MWVIVDHLTKLSHLIPIQMIYTMSTLVRVYQDQIVRLDGDPGEIVSNRDLRLPHSFGDPSRESWAQR